MRDNLKIKKIPLFIILFALFFSYGSNIAKTIITEKEYSMQTGEKKIIDVDGDSYGDLLVEVLEIDPISGRPIIKTKSLVPSQAGGSQFSSSPFIAQYIAAMYKYAIVIISILATILIIFAGVQWTISGGSPDKIKSAKQMIARAFTGLAIALGSYALLATINPDLVTFRNLEVLYTSKIVEIPQDYTMPKGTPEDPPEKNLVALTQFTSNKITFSPGVDRRATETTAAALKSALDEFAKNDSGDVNVIISTAYRSPLSQYGLMTEKCGCKSIDELLKAEDKKTTTTTTTDVKAGEWGNYCKNLTNCKVGYKTLAFTDKKFQAPNIAHFGGNAFDISVALTGAIKPCGDISVDYLARQSAGVVNAGPYKKDWCIPKQQQLLIRAMRNNGFCVGIKNGSDLREPWHFEYINEGAQLDFCTASDDDPNIEKLKYLQDYK